MQNRLHDLSDGWIWCCFRCDIHNSENELRQCVYALLLTCVSVLLFRIIMHQNSWGFVFQDSYFLSDDLTAMKKQVEWRGSEPGWLLVQLIS